MKKLFSFIVIISEITLIVVLSFAFYQKLFEVKAWQDAEEIYTSMPFGIFFSQSMISQSIEDNIEIKPAIPFEFQWDDSNRRLTILPASPLRNDTTYKVVINKARSFAGTIIYNQSFSFTTNPEESFAYSFPKAKQTEKKIDINLKTQVMSLWQDGKMLGEYIISSGKKTTPTLTGDFKVLTKLTTAYGCGDGQCWRMPYWLGFYTVSGSENGIHELPFIRTGSGWFREGQSSLGYAVSHGCVRLSIGNAETIYNWAATGTPVLVHY